MSPVGVAASLRGDGGGAAMFRVEDRCCAAARCRTPRDPFENSGFAGRRAAPRVREAVCAVAGEPDFDVVTRGHGHGPAAVRIREHNAPGRPGPVGCLAVRNRRCRGSGHDSDQGQRRPPCRGRTLHSHRDSFPLIPPGRTSPTATADQPSRSARHDSEESGSNHPTEGCGAWPIDALTHRACARDAGGDHLEEDPGDAGCGIRLGPGPAAGDAAPGRMPTFWWSGRSGRAGRTGDGRPAVATSGGYGTRPRLPTVTA